jgi:hypothetical protein
MTRRLALGGRQGMGDPPLSHSEQGEGPGMALSPFVWSAGVLCAALWAAFLWVAFA